MTDPTDAPKVLPRREQNDVLTWVVHNIEDLWRRSEALSDVALSALRNGYRDDTELPEAPDRVEVVLDRAVWLHALHVATTPLPPPLPEIPTPLPEVPDG